MRICIAGGPRVGKTTLAETLARDTGAPLRSTDAALLGKPWSEQSDVAGTWLEADGPWIIEGVPVVRALRKWLLRHSGGKPCDTLYWRFEARRERSGGQETLATGCRTIYDEIAPELRRRGVEIRAF